MFWMMLPFGIILLLITATLLAGSMVNKLVCRSQEPLAKAGETGQKRALAMVDRDGGVRYLSREEYDSLKRLNPRLMELSAYGIVYLTEVPELGQLARLAVPKTCP
jgi:hypothetical protein